ncbi:MAG TPA: hypothetical protein VFF77_09375 [Holophagaceae bacterium]|nr:hypothetical protein [Holophagaceae bacterium]
MDAQHISIRFNTDKERVSLDLPAWRVMVDGVEHLAHHVRIEVPMRTTEDRLPTGKLKWHLSCEGRVSWEADSRVCVIS